MNSDLWYLKYNAKSYYKLLKLYNKTHTVRIYIEYDVDSAKDRYNLYVRNKIGNLDLDRSFLNPAEFAI